MAQIEALQAMLAARRDVRLAYIFGSAITGLQTPSSDIDIAVSFDPQPEPALLDVLTEELEAACGRRVDLVDLSKASPLLAHEVIRGRCIVEKDPDFRAEF